MKKSFSAEAFLALLRKRNLPYGQPATLKQTTVSTNDDALEALKAGALPGALFVAEQQTAGRGRHGRHWHSAPGDSLTFSLVLRPRVPQDRLSTITLVIGLAVLDALRLHDAQGLKLKWPNDIVHERKKLVGILVEKPQTQHELDTGLVVGVGINVGMASIPAELAAEATALSQLLSPVPSREALLVDALSCIARRVAQLEEHGFSALVAEIRGSDALHGQRIAVEEQQGVASGIGESGELLLDCDGQLRRVTAGTVRYLS